MCESTYQDIKYKTKTRIQRVAVVYYKQSAYFSVSATRSDNYLFVLQ